MMVERLFGNNLKEKNLRIQMSIAFQNIRKKYWFRGHFNFFLEFLRLKNRMCQTFYEPIVPDTTGIQVRNNKNILSDPKMTGSTIYSSEKEYCIFVMTIKS